MGKPRKEVRLYLEIIQTYCTKIIKGSLHGDAICHACELYNLNFQSGPNNFGKEAKSLATSVLNVFAFKSRIHNMVSVLSMAFYSPHNRFEGRPSCRGNVSIFWAQRFERKCRTKIAAPQN